MMSWTDWLNVAGSVIDVASSIASLLDDVDNDPNPYTLGGVQFGNSGGTLYAYNPLPNPMLLNFALVQTQGGAMSTTTSPVQIAATQGAEIGGDLTQFTNGTVTITPMADPNADVPGVSWLGFSVGAIALGTAITIVGGITASFSNNNGVYSFSIVSTNGARMQSARVKIKGANGTSVDTGVTFIDTADDGSTGTVELPTGLNIDPMIESLEINLAVDDTSLQRLLAPYKRAQYPLSHFQSKKLQTA